MMADDPSTQTPPGADSKQGRGAVERVRWGVPDWVRRAGINSWLFLGMVLAASVVVLLIAASRDITAPMALGAFLAIVFLPVVDGLEQRGVGRPLGSALVLAGLTLAFAGVGLITAEALGSQSDALSENLRQAVDEVKGWAEDLPIVAQAVEELDETAHDVAPVARDGVATGVATIVDTAAGFVAGLILGAMILYYLMKDGPTLARRWVDRGGDAATQASMDRIVGTSLQDVQGYFRGKTALALVNGVSIAVAMAVMGVPAALAIGVVNFVGGYIPYIGAFIGGAFAVLMALGEGGAALALAAFAVVMIAQLALENLLEPKLLGASLNLHPLAILLATTLGGLVAGMIGLILAAPVLAISLDLFHELEDVGFFDEEET